MVNYNISKNKNYILTDTEEKELISEINHLLENLEKYLDSSDFENIYYSSIPLSHTICEFMLKLMLKQEGYSIPSNHITLSTIIPTSENIIPQQYIIKLYKIEKLKNEIFHENNSSLKNISSFFNEFSEFINWFNSFYSKEYHIEEPFMVEGTIFKINFLISINENDITKKIEDSLKQIEDIMKLEGPLKQNLDDIKQ